MTSHSWFVYMVRCSDDSLYTGIAMDVERRINEHNSDDISGAKYTRPRRPVRLVYQEQVGSRSEAASREHAIKKLTRQKKEALIKQ
jgi:putative endonuclease